MTCQKSFLKESSFYDHRNRHKRNIICDLCGKNFSSRILLAKHNLRIHATEEEKKRAKKFACNFCSFRCYTNTNLKLHEQIHNETLNFRCDQCDFSSKTKNALSLHLGRTHLGKWRLTQERKDRTNAKKREMQQKKKIENGGLYRAGEERETFNKYMRELQHRERVTCEDCHRETVNLEWHKKMRCNRFK